ncbi:hypothetical protein GCM10023187_01090 [Nibrella viscosa]|uniref:Uncharacterized protein n=1 Tax=Nibrella viscosa TaxID=1084524 RepID=A0ABP8JR00_9BACT
MTLKKIHFVSGLTIAIFISLHLVNHMLSVFGADNHINVMNTMRLIYRNIFVESILLIGVFVQIISGLKLFKSYRKITTTKFEKLGLWTGLYLVVFFIMHISAVLGGRFFLHLDTNFYFGVAGLNSFPYNLFFIPYYGLAIISFFGHIAAVHRKKMNGNILNFPPEIQSIAILVFGVLLTIFLFFGLTNHFKGVTIPKEYEILIGK